MDQFVFRKHDNDRVGVTGLRPSPLPHHRQCGFPQRRLNPAAYAAESSDGAYNP